MKQFVLRGGELITPTEISASDLFVTDGKLALSGSVKAREMGEYEVVDVSNCYVTPGLIDLQVNGGGICNLWEDPTIEEFDSLCVEMTTHGVTSFLPTLITDDVDHMFKNILFLESRGIASDQARSANGEEPLSKPQHKIDIAGIHLEGPFLSPERVGVHPPQFVIPFSMDALKKLARSSVKLVTLAPEKTGADEALSFLRDKNVAVALGHSNATFDEAKAAFQKGIKMVTHVFNALPPMHHRQPGAVGCALLHDGVSCCIICDGLHVNPEMVRLVVKTKGVEQVVLVTDIAFIGTKSGSLVGSSFYLDEAVRNVVKWGIAGFAEAIRMATLNPAKAINLENRIGKLADGYPANLVIWDKKSLAIKAVYFAGEKIFSSASAVAQNS